MRGFFFTFHRIRPKISHENDFSEVIVMSAFLPIVGWLGDRVPPKYLITVGLLGTACCNALASIQHLPSVIALIWCFNGFFQSMIWPPLVRIMAEAMSGDAYRKTCVNVITAANAGTVFVYMIAPLLIRIGSWRWLLMLPAFAAVAVACIWQIFVKAGRTANVVRTAQASTGDRPSGSSATASLSAKQLSLMSGVPLIFSPSYCRDS